LQEGTATRRSLTGPGFRDFQTEEDTEDNFRKEMNA